MMSGRINFVVTFIGILLVVANFSMAQSEKAVFHILVFKSDSSVLRSGTGFFLDGNQGYTVGEVFKNASFATAVTVDSTVHRIISITGFDLATGLTKFDLDNMLSANIHHLKATQEMSAAGTLIKVLYSPEIKSVKQSSIKIDKKGEFVGYGQAVVTSSGLDANTFGGPALNASGTVEGLVMPMSGNDGYIVNMKCVDNLTAISKTVSEFGGSVKTSPFLQQAILAMQSEDAEGALSAFGKAKSAFPNSVTAFYYSGILNYQQEKISAARADLSKAIELDKSLSQAYYIRAVINFNNDDFKNAVTDFTAAEELKVNELKLYEMRGKARYELKDGERASADFAKAIAMGTKDPVVYFLLGNGKFRGNDYKGAIEDYSKAISLGQGDEIIYNNRGKAKYFNKDYDGAIADYTKALTVNPD
jgi:Flp pilus assembly protein TadD